MNTMSSDSLLKELSSEDFRLYGRSVENSYYIPSKNNIILQNNSLTKEILGVKKKLFEQKSAYEEVDDELDLHYELETITQSRNSLLGYLKNLEEIRELQCVQSDEIKTAYTKNLSLSLLMNIIYMTCIFIVTTTPIQDEIVATCVVSFTALTGLIIFASVYNTQQFYIHKSKTTKKLRALCITNEMVGSLIDNM
jgi:hypothetical protein